MASVPNSQAWGPSPPRQETPQEPTDEPKLADVLNLLAERISCIDDRLTLLTGDLTDDLSDEEAPAQNARKKNSRKTEEQATDWSLWNHIPAGLIVPLALGTVSLAGRWIQQQQPQAATPQTELIQAINVLAVRQEQQSREMEQLKQLLALSLRPPPATSPVTQTPLAPLPAALSSAQPEPAARI